MLYYGVCALSKCSLTKVPASNTMQEPPTPQEPQRVGVACVISFPFSHSFCRYFLRICSVSVAQAWALELQSTQACVLWR